MSTLIIQHKLKFALAFVVILMAVAGVFLSGKPVASQSDVPSAWTVRCAEQEKSKCEIFWRYIVPETKQRVAEFAVGFPEDSKTARGVLVLPLGVLLTEDAQMQIDSGQAFKFKVRYCTAGGCSAFLNMSTALLESMRKGTLAVVTLKSMNGQPVRIEIPLAGFGKTLEQIS